MKIVKKHFWKIMLLIIALTILINYQTSSTLTKKVYQLLEKNCFVQIDLTEYISYLQDNGYEIKEETQDSFHNIHAYKNDSYIRIDYFLDSMDTKSIVFRNTDDKITPFLEDIQWSDSYSDVKKKIGLNSFNTLTGHMTSRFGTNVSYAKTRDYRIVTFMKDETTPYAYSLHFDADGKFESVMITYYSK